MSKTRSVCRSVMAVAVGLAVLLAAPGMARAQTVTGAAVAIQATVSGLFGSTTTELASTGSLVDDTDARDASGLSGAIPSLVSADVLHATTISSISQWDPTDNVSSEASLADLAVTVAGNQISATFVMAGAFAPVGGGTMAWSTVDGLAINGVPIALTGTESETISLPGLRIVANEVVQSVSGITVNALHITSMDGLVDVVVASATAGVQ